LEGLIAGTGLGDFPNASDHFELPLAKALVATFGGR